MENISYSELFNKLGLGFIDIGYIIFGMLIIILVLVILMIIQMINTKRMKKRINKLVSGKSGESLEQEITELFQDIELIKNISDKNKKDIRSLYRNMESAYQKMGLVKYDAFRQMGGQLSFSLCLLNENNNGFIINSVHSTEGCYSYTKEIKDGKSTILLGEEETQALEIAMENKK